MRVTFAYPWQGMLLLGTTDTLYEGDPSEVAVEPADITRILDEASVGVEREVLDPRSRPGELRGAAGAPRPERRDADGAARDRNTSSAAAGC